MGGSIGYDNAAHELSRHIASLAPWELDADEWERRLDELDGYLGNSEFGVRMGDGPILAWFDACLPRCMALVPTRRRGAFAKGVRQFYEEHQSFGFRLAGSKP